MNTKLTYTAIWALLVLTASPNSLAAKSCAAMQKELAQLRAEYHEYVTVEGPKSGGVKFERLVEILDKIIELKRAMTSAQPQCPIPSRKRSTGANK
jgi:hypothetical protein